jgi:hypothetical protein
MTTKSKAARKGGLALVAKHGKDHMAAIGRNGAKAFWAKYTLVKLGTSDFAIAYRETGKLTGKTMNGKFIPTR